MKIEINHFLPETASDDEKWILTFYHDEPAHGHPFFYHASIPQEVYKVIKHLQSQNKELIEKLTQCETANIDFQSENKELIKANEKECKWVLEYDTSWDSQCGQSFLFNHKGPIYNGFKYCPFCGNKMNQNEKE